MCEHGDDQGSQDIVIEGKMVPLATDKSFVLVTASGHRSLVMGPSTETLSYFSRCPNAVHRSYL